jgi:hypothetical protein
MIRNRAKRSAVQDPAVNNKVEPYPTGTFATRGQGFSINAVRFEQRLEFAMEGMRFFDLVRWGIAEKVLNAYVAKEGVSGTDINGRTFSKRNYLAGKVFLPKHNLFPIPQDEILNSQKDGKSVLVQNPGY